MKLLTHYEYILQEILDNATVPRNRLQPKMMQHPLQLLMIDLQKLFLFLKLDSNIVSCRRKIFKRRGQGAISNVGASKINIV